MGRLRVSVDIAKQLPTVISFCSGYGGIERGLDLAGVEHRVLAYVEIEAFAIANLVAKMESGQLVPAPIFTDLKTFPAHLFRDCVDIITGGYPCQPFSAAGKRLGTEDPRHLWPFIRRHIESIRPVQCFFENVEGHISLGLQEVIEDLEGLGYSTTWGIFSAAEVGAPHQRKRVYILGSDTNCRDGSAQQERKYKRPKELDGCGDWGLAASGSENMANSDSERQSGWPETNGRQARSSVEGSDEPNLANAEGVRVQRLRSGWQQEPNPHGKAQLFMRESKRSTAPNWLPEPQLGRVVDGCADRVDRLRLLGNGVVPQTAAKAWITLVNKEITG